MPEDNTTVLQVLLGRLKAGDEAARWELVGCVEKRLRGLAARILNESFPRLKAQGIWSTTDLTSEVKLRIVKALEDDKLKVELTDLPHFFRLAAMRIRWILLDTVKHCPKDSSHEEPSGLPLTMLSASSHEEVMAKLLELAEQLPEEQREVVDLKFWMDWDNNQIAEELKVSTKTVGRRWVLAKAELGNGIINWLKNAGKESS